MKIRMLEMIRIPFLAAKGEIKDVHDDVAIELERHGHAEVLIDADEEDADDETEKPAAAKKHKSRGSH